MNMRSNHPHRPPRHPWNTLPPQLRRQILNEIDRHPMARPPRIDQRLYVPGILGHSGFAYSRFTPKPPKLREAVAQITPKAFANSNLLWSTVRPSAHSPHLIALFAKLRDAAQLQFPHPFRRQLPRLAVYQRPDEFLFDSAVVLRVRFCHSVSPLLLPPL